MKQLIENWRDYEKNVMKEEFSGDDEEEITYEEAFLDAMTVSWDDTKTNPETGESEEFTNYALNPSFLPADQQEELKSSIPIQEGGQETSLRQHYIDQLSAAPPEEALQEAMPVASIDSGAEAPPPAASTGGLAGELWDGYTYGDAFLDLTTINWESETEAGEKVTKIIPFPLAGAAGKGALTLSAKGMVILHGKLLTKAAESGFGRKAATFFAKQMDDAGIFLKGGQRLQKGPVQLGTVGPNIDAPAKAIDRVVRTGKDYKGLKPSVAELKGVLMKGGKDAISYMGYLLTRVAGSPPKALASKIAAWQGQNAAFKAGAGSAKATAWIAKNPDKAFNASRPIGFGPHRLPAPKVPKPGAEPKHFPWFKGGETGAKVGRALTKNRTLDDVADVLDWPIKKIGSSMHYTASKAKEFALANPGKTTFGIIAGLIAAGYNEYNLRKDVEAAKDVDISKLAPTSTTDIFKSGTTPSSGAEPGKVNPIKTKEQQQESMTRTEEIVREEVNKFLSNRRKS